MADLASLQYSLPAHGRRLEGGIQKLVKDVTMQTVEALAGDTPVDTGKARSNWLVSLGSEDSEVIEPHSPGSHLGVNESRNLEATLAAARSAVEARTPGQDVIVQNNVPYIGLLNEGSSSQAPAAFVESAVQRAVEYIKSARLGL